MNRLELAHFALLGTSIGDAFGDSFFGERARVEEHIAKRQIPETKWEFTDDTIMSLAVFEQLEMNGEIVQDELISQFVQMHSVDPNRGYGATVRRILREFSEGGSWQELSKNAFDGMGSMGNGAAMRVASLGAFFFDDLKKIKEQATLSATVTHANKEAIVGAQAVAIAASVLIRSKDVKLSSSDFLKQVIAELDDSDTKSKIEKSLKVPSDYRIESVKSILGNGEKMLAQDTVPFALWCVAHHKYNFEEAIWKGVSILGDRDTICAIIGGLTIVSAPKSTIPELWLRSVEDVDKSRFRNLMM